MSQQTLPIYKLYFQTPLHLSRGKRDTYESTGSIIHSDSLKSALFVSVMQLFGEEEANIFMDSVHLSSAFPFDVKGGLYLPKPISYKPQEENIPKLRKEAKKIKYLTISQMESVLQGRHPSDLLDQNQKAVQPNIWIRNMTQRVKINSDDDNETYYLEKLYPNTEEETGVYFIVKSDYDEEKLYSALRLLGDNGIGLQRGLGNGQFVPRKDSMTIHLPDSSDAWMALSLYRPSSLDEIAPCLNNSFYQFQKRGGWISSPQSEDHLSIRKQTIMMFSEGSVFQFDSMSDGLMVKGNKEDVKPENVEEFKPVDHPVWRDGKALFLPIKAIANG